MVGGIQITASQDGGTNIDTSTLGFCAINPTNNKIGFVVAGHAASEIGTPVCQPYFDAPSSDYYYIGTVDIIGTPEGLLHDWMEADSSFVEYDDVAPQIHLGNGVLAYVDSYEDPAVGMVVYKSGRATGLTYGTVTKVRDDFTYWPEGIYLHNQAFASFDIEETDSGSPVYTTGQEQLRSIVGIAIAYTDNGNTAVFSPVSGIEEELGVVPYTIYDTEYDWNPWNDPDSDDAALISTNELQQAVNRWFNDNPAPLTGATVTTDRLSMLVHYWVNTLPCPAGADNGDGMINKESRSLSDISANRSFSSYNVTPNSTFIVTVNISTCQDIDSPVLDENYPFIDGTAVNITNETIRLWNVTAVDNNGGTLKNSTAEWIWASGMSGGENCTITYNVTVPGNLSGGIYNISGSVSGYNVSATEVGGDSSVYVMDDWNPWNDWDSEDGRYISLDEIRTATLYWKYSAPIPRTSHILSLEDIRLITLYWKYSVPM